MRDNSDHSLPFLKLVYAEVDIYSRAKLIFILRKTQEAEHRRVVRARSRRDDSDCEEVRKVIELLKISKKLDMMEVMDLIIPRLMILK